MADLTIEELKKNHDRMFEHGKITREKSADDLTFYHVTQWDDSTLGESDLGFKGEFNVIRRAGRQIIGDLISNPVQVDFEPKAESDQSGGDFIDGYYRSIDRMNSSIEAYDNAKQEAVVCGIGGWELYTVYETNQVGDENQVQRRRPIHEFNNNVFWDESAVLKDKSDADRVSILVPLSARGMEKLAEDLTGVVMSGDTSDFKYPEHSYTFPWLSGKDEIHYAVRYYERILSKDHVLTMIDPSGQELRVLGSSIKEIEDELIDEGYTIEESKEIKRYKVKLYIANGNRILKSYDIAGQHIPVCVMYGERAFIEGEEHYEGVTRLAKDPQRLRNFQMSYLADIVSRSPRPKPIFYPEQIAGLEYMYETNGSENNYPYLLQHMKDPNGTMLPLGAIGQLPEQTIPQALMIGLQETRQAVTDVAPANISSDLSDIDLSGKALSNLTARLDEQSIVYQQNFKHASRRDGEIFASMATVIIDAPRKITITLPDGTRKVESIMETIMDEETGELKVINDITGMEFEVFAAIGASYSTKKEESFEKLGELSVQSAQLDPQLSRMFLLKQAQLIDGVNMEDVRDWARKQSILSGFSEPETDEEKKMMMQAQQQGNEQPDSNLIAAQAMDKEADAKLMAAQNNQFKIGNDAQNNDAKTQIDQFKAETDRFNVQVNAEKVGAEIDYKRADMMGKHVDRVINNSNLRASVSRPAMIQ